MKPCAEFSRVRTGPWGYHSYWKSCQKAAFVKRNRDNPDRIKAIYKRARLKRYGLTEQSFEKLWVLQEGLCALCGFAMDEDGSRGPGRHVPNVDHDHATGKVRGILCSLCNFGLGCFQDDPVIDRKSTRLNSSHQIISYAVFCLKKKKDKNR